jgi:hypothetical protein
MEPLESKLDRLSPEQLREIEDFVDFLLQRQSTLPAVPSVQEGAPSLPAAATPPLAMQEPSFQSPSPRIHDLICTQEPSPAPPQEDPATMLIQEIAGDDPLTGEYMDYGRFEKETTTVTAKKIQARPKPREQDNSAGLLEWID